MQKLSGSRERCGNGLFCRESGARIGVEGDIKRGLSDFDARRGFADAEPLLDQGTGPAKFFGGYDRLASAPPAA